jgi:hypothetical protein
MGAPRRVEADCWLCPFLIRGIVESGIHYAVGSDALQSIIMALAGIRLYLNQTGRQFIWFGDDHGIPRHVPTDYGRTFAQRVDRAIERESKRVQVGWLRTRKAEIASAEERLKVLKKGGYRSKVPEAKADREAEIVKREAQLKAAKKGAATWEAGLKKWKLNRSGGLGRSPNRIAPRWARRKRRSSASPASLRNSIDRKMSAIATWRYSTVIGIRTSNSESTATPFFIAGKKRHCLRVSSRISFRRGLVVGCVSETCTSPL